MGIRELVIAEIRDAIEEATSCRWDSPDIVDVDESVTNIMASEHMHRLLDLAELADDPEHPEYRLAVVDSEAYTSTRGFDGDFNFVRHYFYQVVKMEGQPIDKHGATGP